MVYVAFLVLIIAIILLVYSIALLMGKDGSLFSLFTHKEKSLNKAEKLAIYIMTIVLLVISLVWLLNII